jgi:biopolymer transport protein ExbD
MPMRFESTGGDALPRINFIPLIDIVLQIICFYLFVSAGVQAYQDASVHLPVMTAKPLSSQHPAEFVINIEANGTLDVNGRTADASQLPGLLTEARDKATAANQSFMVAIRADKRQHFALLDQVLQACRQARVQAVAVRALTEPGGSRP